MSEIKTALERFQAYCDSKGIPEKSSLAHIHKIDQFEEHERKELRAAYEALQKENAELKDRIAIMDEAAKYHNETIISISNKLHAENESLKLKKEFIEDAAQDIENQNAAQAKRIEEHIELIEATAEFSKAFWENAYKHSDTRVMVSTFQQLERKLRTYLPASKNGE